MESLVIRPATPDRWEDLERLFGPHGAIGNCWCTWWILRAREWETTPPGTRREILRDLVAEGAEPGLLAYDGGEAVGWCAVGPRERYARMTSPRARTFGPLDDEPSWVVNCFFIARSARGRGVATALLAAAVEYAFAHGAERIEAYPIDPDAQATNSNTLFTGHLPTFLAAGFVEVARVGKQPVVRLTRAS